MRRIALDRSQIRRVRRWASANEVENRAALCARNRALASRRWRELDQGVRKKLQAGGNKRCGGQRKAQRVKTALWILDAAVHVRLTIWSRGAAMHGLRLSVILRHGGSRAMEGSFLMARRTTKLVWTQADIEPPEETRVGRHEEAWQEGGVMVKPPRCSKAE